MAAQRLSERSYSATALQQFASCPYRFFLYAVHRLAPREQPEAIDEMDALQRGSLVHEVQFELFGRLAKDGLLPVSRENLAAARVILESVLDEVAARYRDQLVPAIDRVWEDGVAAVRADLREWLQRCSDDESGFVPWRFELSFGLAGRRERDPNSVPDPVPLDCGIQLRGSIDLVERRPDDVLRVTDHKTGRRRVEPGDVIAGGTSLQPVLYALACEKLFPNEAVRSGRLYYCTSAGGFEESDVPLDASARAAADLVARVVDGALAEPFLPAAPAPQACRFCDYQLVCGPYEELRTGRKWTGHAQIEALQTLREAR
jgi:ATP-dependent helicase/DNAse subunit B